MPAAKPAPDVEVHAVVDSTTGLRAWIAIDDTSLGPAFGGCRFKHYADDDAAIADACRLAGGMSLKNALAGIPFGGGKAVIRAPDGDFDRAALFEAFGRAVDALQGRYITAMDSGTETSDMDAIGRATRFVSGRTGVEGDPSPFTARGVFQGIRAAVRHSLDRREFTGLTVAIQGAGHVGAALAVLLADAGARVLIADPVAQRAEQVAARTGAAIVAVADLPTTPCDVLAPCGLGGILDARVVDALHCRIVAGAANNQLAEPEVARLLVKRGITYVPDFVINAGGVIHAALAWQGVDEAEIGARVDRIGATVTSILEGADRRGLLPVQTAWEHARGLIAASA
ncbi:MAG TPA: Glu/Leu/Phe/Val dehydrogenase dimerization domain-containing protein [Pseudomonadales bacterium]|nr:Glu/Leu/Phe/Val dehydrogenase dimerization domain-containing protein [Pseudomonadales bacterium]